MAVTIKRTCLFLRIVWRPCVDGSRLSIRRAWEAACVVWP